LIIRGLDHLSSFYQPLAYSYSPWVDGWGKQAKVILLTH
jgi:hypothetical protein